MIKVKEHLCKTCGETDPEKFYTKHKIVCKLCRNQITKKYYQNNKQAIREKQKQYVKDNAQDINTYKIQYRKSNVEFINERKKKFYRDNKKSIIKESNRYIKERRQKDPGFKYLSNLRSRQGQVFRGKASTTEGLGCNSQELRDYLESLFQEGMTHENHGNGPGKWNIDHIEPLSSYDKDLNGDWCSESDWNKKLIHYTNLQPLWEEDNLKKGAKRL